MIIHLKAIQSEFYCLVTGLFFERYFIYYYTMVYSMAYDALMIIQENKKAPLVRCRKVYVDNLTALRMLMCFTFTHSLEQN